MKYVREHDVEGERVGAPYQRIIRHLVTPSESGSKNLWVGSSSIDP